MYIQEDISEQLGAGTTVVEARRSRFWTACGIAALLLVSGCGQEATAPADLGTVSFLIVSGDAQSGVVGTELPQPLVIKATNSKGSVISDLTVSFRVTSGGGSMYAGVASTDSKGIAEDYWTLGTSTVQVQRVEVRAVLSTGQKQVYGVFTATPLAGPAAQIVVQAGDGQTANASTNVPIAPAVLVRDQYGNQVPGLVVTFAVASGGGSVTGGNATTSASGIATVGSWTLGPGGGSNTLTATASGSAIAGNPVTFTATALQPSNTWATKTPMPTARQGLGVATINGTLYAVGGSDPSGLSLATVEAYDAATDTWSTKASMSTARRGLGVTAINGLLYAVGGSDVNGILGTVEVYDPATNIWTTKASMPTARTGLAVAAVDGILYAVGGLSSVILGTVEAYDPTTDTWTTEASTGNNRDFLGLAAVNRILYAVGGGNSTGVLATVEAYDPITDIWTPAKGPQLAPMPTARSGLGVAVINGILYAVGGVAGGGIVSTVEAYQP
jgi:Kelch motif protein